MGRRNIFLKRTSSKGGYGYEHRVPLRWPTLFSLRTPYESPCVHIYERSFKKFNETVLSFIFKLLS